jgi:hypothetical protein
LDFCIVGVEGEFEEDRRVVVVDEDEPARTHLRDA